MSEEGSQRWSDENGGGDVEASLRSGLEAQMADGESVMTSLRSTKQVVHEGPDHTERFEPVTGETARAVVSDRRLYFAVGTDDGTEVIEIPYRDVRDVEVSDSLLSSSLTVRVWNRGTYRFSPARGEDVTGAGETIEAVVRGWQRVLSALEAANEYVTELGRHVGEGERVAAERSRAAVQRELSRAGTRIDEAPGALRRALEDRVEEVATELQLRRVQAHVARGTDLIAEGRQLTEDEAWDDAAGAFRLAREHLETALSASVERGFDTVESILQELDELEEGQSRLAERPLALAEEARAVAQAADSTATAVAAWADAVANYRAALTTAWGHPIDFAGDPAVLRWQIEWAAGNLIDARQERAQELEEAADRRLSDGLTESSRGAYRDATAQLEDAAALASELRVGDSKQIRAQQEWIRDKLATAGA